MAEIRIEGKPIFGLDGGVIFGHLYLVFVDDGGDEWVIRGGPDPENPLGNISIENNIPIATSKDSRDISQRAIRGSTILDLGGRDATAVWQQMQQHAAGIARANLPYSIGSIATNAPYFLPNWQNSN